MSKSAKKASTPAQAAAEAAPEKSAAQSGPEAAIIVVGRNDHGMGQAAWFTAADADLASRAAAMLGFRVIPIENDEQREVVKLLRPGQVYAASPSFAPTTSPATYDRLTAALGPIERQAIDRSSFAEAETWDAIKPGHAVIAQGDDREDGWWECIVVDVEGEMLVLRWRDWPGDPAVRRLRRSVALIAPAIAA